MKAAEQKLVHKLTLALKKSSSQRTNVLRTSVAKEWSLRVKKSPLKFLRKVEQDQSPITINLFLEDLEALSRPILKRNM